MNATAKKERTPEQLEKMRAGLAKARATAAANRAKRQEGTHTAAPKSFLQPGHRSADPPTTSEFEGITATACCDACGVNRCVISGENVCTHPYKGGLHAKHMMRPETVARFNRAKKALAIQAVEKRVFDV